MVSLDLKFYSTLLEKFELSWKLSICLLNKTEFQILCPGGILMREMSIHLTEGYDLQDVHVCDHLFQFINDW